MSLASARRTPQWKVIFEALERANVGTELIEFVENAKAANDIIQGVVAMASNAADENRPKNYLKFEMDGIAAPFDRVYIEVVRPGGKTSHELREMLRDRLFCVRNALVGGTPSDGMRAGLIEGINKTLEAEAP